jgi:hypothetical protein
MCLDALSTAEEPTRWNAYRNERTVVRPTIKRRRLGGQAFALETVDKDPLDRIGSRRSGRRIRIGRAITVVDEPDQSEADESDSSRRKRLGLTAATVASCTSPLLVPLPWTI